MPRRLWNDGQEIVQSDLSAVSSSLEMELYDRIILELMNRQDSVVFQGSFKASNINSTTSQLAAGNGVYKDNTQVDPEPQHRLLYLAATQNLTHSAADASHNRIDLIYVTPGRGNTSTQSRNFKDAGTGIISSQSMVVETDWAPTFAILAGTPGVSPAVPSTPAGSMALCQVLVTAATGISGAGAYTDVRPIYAPPSSFKKVTAVTTTYTALLTDETITANANGGAFAITLPAASASTGKSFKIIKIDSTANAVTVTAAGSDLIIGQATQLLSTQFTSLTLDCDGTEWYLS